MAMILATFSVMILANFSVMMLVLFLVMILAIFSGNSGAWYVIFPLSK